MQRQQGTGPIAKIADFHVAISVKETGYSWQLGALVQPDTSAIGAPRENWRKRKRKMVQGGSILFFPLQYWVSGSSVPRQANSKQLWGSQKSKDKLDRLSGHATNQMAVPSVLIHVPLLLPKYGRPNFNAAGGPPGA